jgi:hypothetical protein
MHTRLKQMKRRAELSAALKDVREEVVTALIQLPNAALDLVTPIYLKQGALQEIQLTELPLPMVTTSQE